MVNVNVYNFFCAIQVTGVFCQSAIESAQSDHAPWHAYSDRNTLNPKPIRFKSSKSGVGMPCDCAWEISEMIGCPGTFTAACLKVVHVYYMYICFMYIYISYLYIAIYIYVRTPDLNND